MKSFHPVIPPHVADVIRSLHPDLKRSVKSAIRAVAADPECGEPLLRELQGLWKYRVRRFRVVYAIDRKTRVLRIMAVGHRQSIYEELTARLEKKRYRGTISRRVADRLISPSFSPCDNRLDRR